MAMLAGLAAFASARSVSKPPAARAAVENPELKLGCGLKVALVLDESQSISNGVGGFDAAAQVRSAATAFTEALEGTGSPLALTSFHSIGDEGVPYQEVTPGNITTFTSWIGSGPDSNNPGGYNPPTSVQLSNTTANQPNGTTNWQDGLQQVPRTTSVPGVPSGPPDLVVFVTDGNPNTVGSPPRDATDNPGPIDGLGRVRYISNEDVGRDQAASAAERVANDLKAHSKIFGIFVGPDTEQEGSTRRIQQITGTHEGSSPLDSDYAIIPDFDGLKSEMTSIVASLCGSRLLVTKEVPDHNGELTNASGWKFTTTLDPAHEHTWLHPTHGTGGNADDASASLTTGNDGIADFQWRLHEAESSVRVSAIHETEHPGFHFVTAICHDVGPDGVIEESQVVSTTGIPGATLGREDFRTCTVVNRPSMARLTVVKHLEPSGDPGRFNLEVGGQIKRHAVGNLGSTGPITLPLGDHTVSETGADGTNLSDYHTSIRCVDLAHNYHVVAQTNDAAELSVPLENDGQDVVCTITNVSRHSGQITVIKHLVPQHDPGRFDLLVNGTAHAHHVGDGGRAGPIRLPFGTHHVTEHATGGTSLGHYNISTRCIDENTGHTVAHNAHGPAVSVHLSEAADNIQCTIQNERHGVHVARLEVVKHLVPHDDAARFDLLVGGRAFAVGVGHHGSTGPLDFELGRHAVTERGAHGTHLGEFAISTTCVDRAHHNRTVAHNAHGPGVSVNLSNTADNIVCTITNRRTEPPGEGGGEVPGDVPTPPDPGPHLGVVKTMPAHAHVNELVPITIVVHNHGHGTAHGVQLHENRPAGMRIVEVADHGTIQHNGTAVWHLGNLAPGASRTVHATARVLHTGLHVDTAVATALNADPALSDAAVRARAAAAHRPTPPHRRHRRHRPHPPRFTG